MFSTSDTIVAIATPGGRGGLGIVRLSGPDAHEISRTLAGRERPLEPRRATFCRLRVGRLLDQVVLTFFPHPHSYTTDDVVEISAHGSPVVLNAIVREAVARGARLARPGEFTFRAFVNGRIDLTQAEAVADLIEAMTPTQASVACAQVDGAVTSCLQGLDRGLVDLIVRLEASLDFPEEGYHFIRPDGVREEIARIRAEAERLLATSTQGRLLREGARVVITGSPNAGKSSLFNALCGSERAIVARTPGTTRDILVESIDLRGAPVTLIDTAGLRETTEDAEMEGVRRAAAAAEAADLVLLVFDRSMPLSQADVRLLTGRSHVARILVASKCDLPAAWDRSVAGSEAVHEVSALTGFGLQALLSTIAGSLGLAGEAHESPALTNERHADLLRRTAAALRRAQDTLDRLGSGTPEELLLLDLNEAREALDTIAGRRTPDDVLALIFERFCIGK
jgi:tRNA modification GTPase